MAKRNKNFNGFILYPAKNGRYIARMRRGPNKKMKKDPRYERTREHQAAFALASTAGKHIRNFFRAQVKAIQDSRVSSRLTRQLLAALTAGPFHDRKHPNLLNGDLSLIDGFDFNDYASVQDIFSGPYSIDIDKNNRHIEFTIHSFIPINEVDPGDVDVHFKLIAAIAAINLETGERTISEGAHETPLEWNDTPTKPIVLKKDITLKGNLLVIIAMGIQFYQKVNEVYHPRSVSSNAMTIIRALKA